MYNSFEHFTRQRGKFGFYNKIKCSLYSIRLEEEEVGELEEIEKLKKKQKQRKKEPQKEKQKEDLQKRKGVGSNIHISI